METSTPDARAHLVFSGGGIDRDQLVETAAEIASLGEQALGNATIYCCPVQGCKRAQKSWLLGDGGESRQALATHLLADHFTHVKAFRAITEHVAQHATASGACPFNTGHKSTAPHATWEEHCHQVHGHQVWAITLKLLRSYDYSAMPMAYSASPSPFSAFPGKGPSAYDVYKSQLTSSRGSAAGKGYTPLGTGWINAGSGAAKHSTMSSKGPSHKTILYPCPLGCSAPTMPGWQVPSHVLAAHFDTLLKWCREDSRRSITPPVLDNPLLGQTAEEVLHTLATGRSVSAGRRGAAGCQEDTSELPTTSTSVTAQVPTAGGTVTPRPAATSPHRLAVSSSPLSNTYRTRPAGALHIDTHSPVRTSTSTLATSPGATTNTTTGLYSPSWQPQQTGWPWSTAAVVPTDGSGSLPSSPGVGGYDSARSHLPSPTRTLSPSWPRGGGGGLPSGGGTVHHHHHHYHTSQSPGASMQGSLDLYPEALRASTLATSRSQALGPQSPGTALNSSLPLSQSSPWRPTQSIQPYAGPPAWQMQSQVSWPAGVLSIVAEVSRMAAALADMRTTVADMARRVDRTASLEDLRGLLQVLQPQLVGVATSLSDLASSHAASRVAVQSAVDTAQGSSASLRPLLHQVATALRDLADGQAVLLGSPRLGDGQREGMENDAGLNVDAWSQLLGSAPQQGNKMSSAAGSGTAATSEAVAKAAGQLQRQLGAQLTELMRVTDAAIAAAAAAGKQAASPAGVDESKPQPTTTTPGKDSTPELVSPFSPKSRPVPSPQAKTAATTTGQALQRAWPPRRQVPTNKVVVGTWDVSEIKQQEAASATGMTWAIAGALLETGAGIVALQGITSQATLSALHLHLQSADPKGKWAAWMSDNLGPEAAGVCGDGSSSDSDSEQPAHEEGGRGLHHAFLWRSGKGGKRIKAWRERMQEAFKQLPDTHGLFAAAPVYGLFEVHGRPLLLISTSLAKEPPQAVKEVRRLPLLAEAALEQNLDLVTATGGLVGVAILGALSSRAGTLHSPSAAAAAWQAVSRQGWGPVMAPPSSTSAGYILVPAGKLPEGCTAAGVQDLRQAALAPGLTSPAYGLTWFEWDIGSAPSSYQNPSSQPPFHTPDLQLACAMAAVEVSRRSEAGAAPVDEEVMEVGQPGWTSQAQHQQGAQAAPGSAHVTGRHLGSAPAPGSLDVAGRESRTSGQQPTTYPAASQAHSGMGRMSFEEEVLAALSRTSVREPLGSPQASVQLPSASPWEAAGPGLHAQVHASSLHSTGPQQSDTAAVPALNQQGSSSHPDQQPDHHLSQQQLLLSPHSSYTPPPALALAEAMVSGQNSPDATHSRTPCTTAGVDADADLSASVAELLQADLARGRMSSPGAGVNPASLLLFGGTASPRVSVPGSTYEPGPVLAAAEALISGTNSPVAGLSPRGSYDIRHDLLSAITSHRDASGGGGGHVGVSGEKSHSGRALTGGGSAGLSRFSRTRSDALEAAAAAAAAMDGSSDGGSVDGKTDVGRSAQPEPLSPAISIPGVVGGLDAELSDDDDGGDSSSSGSSSGAESSRAANKEAPDGTLAGGPQGGIGSGVVHTLTHATLGSAVTSKLQTTASAPRMGTERSPAHQHHNQQQQQQQQQEQQQQPSRPLSAAGQAALQRALSQGRSSNPSLPATTQPSPAGSVSNEVVGLGGQVSGTSAGGSAGAGTTNASAAHPGVPPLKLPPRPQQMPDRGSAGGLSAVGISTQHSSLAGVQGTAHSSHDASVVGTLDADMSDSGSSTGSASTESGTGRARKSATAASQGVSTGSSPTAAWMSAGQAQQGAVFASQPPDADRDEMDTEDSFSGHGQMQYTASGPASQTGGATSAGQLQQEEEVVVDQSDLDVEDSFSDMMATLPGLGTFDQPLRGAITAAAKEALNATGGTTSSRPLPSDTGTAAAGQGQGSSRASVADVDQSDLDVEDSFSDMMATLPGLGTLDQPLRGAITAAAKEALNATGGSTVSRASETAPVVPANRSTPGVGPGSKPPLPSASSARFTPQPSMQRGLNDTQGSGAGGAGGYSVSASRALSAATSVRGRGSVTSMEDFESDMDDLVESLGLGAERTKQASEAAQLHRLPGGTASIAGRGSDSTAAASVPAIHPSPSLPRAPSQRQREDDDDVLHLGSTARAAPTSASGVSFPSAFSFGQGLRVQAQAVVRSSLSGVGHHQQQQQLSSMRVGAEPDSLDLDLEGLDPRAGGSATAGAWAGVSSGGGQRPSNTSVPSGSGGHSNRPAVGAGFGQQQRQQGLRVASKTQSMRFYEDDDIDVDEVLAL